jgi:lysophospholipase L1-like esterase
MTSCTSVVHIGDSTSDSLVSDDYLSTRQQLPAQYSRVGVHRVVLEISGARSIVETLPGQQNGAEVAQELVAQGYRGCWVIALGTNDAANIAAGANTSAADRIHEMMSIAAGQPVMWVNVISLLSSGPYAESSMQQWNHALLAACATYPNLRIYDWSSVAKPSWFTSDGIHYSSVGSAFRAAGIANALAAAFPRTARSGGRTGATSCAVR